MKKAIIGKKLGMTQIFDEVGNVIPVTIIEAGPCVVAQKKTVEKDGYNALQLGFAEVKAKHLTKPEIGHFEKAGLADTFSAVATRNEENLRSTSELLPKSYAAYEELISLIKAESEA